MDLVEQLVGIELVRIRQVAELRHQLVDVRRVAALAIAWPSARSRSKCSSGTRRTMPKSRKPTLPVVEQQVVAGMRVAEDHQRPLASKKKRKTISP